jgi:hypothetical protein
VKFQRAAKRTIGGAGAVDGGGHVRIRAGQNRLDDDAIGNGWF